MSYLLDTCALSEYTKKAPHPGVLAWLDAQPETGLFISALSLAELENGVCKLQAQPSQAQRGAALALWLAQLTDRFAQRTLPIDAAVWRVWSAQSAAADQAGQPISPMDALLMATAQCHGLSIVTRNTSDFVRYPLVINPWSLA